MEPKRSSAFVARREEDGRQPDVDPQLATSAPQIERFVSQIEGTDLLVRLGREIGGNRGLAELVNACLVPASTDGSKAEGPSPAHLDPQAALRRIEAGARRLAAKRNAEVATVICNQRGAAGPSHTGVASVRQPRSRGQRPRVAGKRAAGRSSPDSSDGSKPPPPQRRSSNGGRWWR